MSGNKGLETGTGSAEADIYGLPLWERPGEPLRGSFVFGEDGSLVPEIPRLGMMEQSFNLGRAMITGETRPRRMAQDLGSVSLNSNIENLTE